MKARIRQGAQVGQDHATGVWGGDGATEVVFQCKPLTPTRELWACTAPGFGDSPYGNGAIYVYKDRDLVPVDVAAVAELRDHVMARVARKAAKLSEAALQLALDAEALSDACHRAEGGAP